MCDRFAARYLVDRLGAAVHTLRHERVPREQWDFQDLEAFITGARRRRVARRPLAPRDVKWSGRP
jgi:hypothetical protein